MYVCPVCKIMPSSHSLQVFEKKGILYYYTCPSKAIFYNDVKGILHHYHGMLSEIPEDKQWVWVFDSVEFGFMHAINTSVAIELAKLITKFSKNLAKIIIINPTMYITMTHKIVLPFLNPKVKNIIEMNNEATCIEDLFV
jgi:hypothetical protein